MVTFVCSYCDVTLKKKQLEKHGYQCGRPCKFICIDCSKTFIGDEYKSHTQCMTEQEKYHGQYAKKPKNQQQVSTQKQQEQKSTVSQQEEQKENKKVEVKKEETSKKQEQVEEPKTNWAGWKKTIRKIIKQKPNKLIKLRKLKELACKEYIECFPEEDKMEAEKVFDQKVASNSKLQTIQEPYVKFA